MSVIIRRFYQEEKVPDYEVLLGCLYNLLQDTTSTGLKDDEAIRTQLQLMVLTCMRWGK